MARTNYKTIVVSPTDNRESVYSDWAIDEADLFRQYDDIFRGWKLLSHDGLTYRITYQKIK